MLPGLVPSFHVVAVDHIVVVVVTAHIAVAVAAAGYIAAGTAVPIGFSVLFEAQVGVVLIFLPYR